MPNRILKDSICTSDNINVLSDKAEILFYRLIVQCDDHGLFDGRPSIIRAKCFPLRVDSIKEKVIEKWLIELSDAGMIKFYHIDGKKYLKMLSWGKHQQIRATHSKYPIPISDDINGNQEISDAPENRIESNHNRESESITCSEQQVASEPPEVILSIPLNDGSGFGVSSEMIALWGELYPAVDIIQELRKMIGWCDASPKRRKTKRGVKAFIASWLSRAQDNSRSSIPRTNSAREPTEKDYSWGQDNSKLPDFMKKGADDNA